MAKVTVSTELQTAGWSAGLAKGGNELKQFVRTAEGSWKNLSLQNGLAGLSGISGPLLNASKAGEELATKLRTGGSEAEAFGSIVEKIPIVGKFKQAGDALREVITGEKAALVELNKMSDSLDRVNAGYRKTVESQQIRGKRGDEKASIQIEQDGNAKIKALNEQDHKLTLARQEIESKSSRVVADSSLKGFHISDADKPEYTAAQNQQLKSIDEEKKQIAKAKTDASLEITTLQKMLKEEAAQRIVEFDRGIDEGVLDANAKNQEKSLRRQGKALESAIVGVNRSHEAKLVELKAKLDPLKMAGLNDDQKAHETSKVNEAIAAETTSHDKTIEELKRESARRKSEITKDSENELFKITAEGNISRLESTGKTYQAEQARIQLAYDDEIGSLEKKIREDQALNGGENIATLRDAEKAAGLKKNFAMDNAGFKDRLEKIKMERAGWESVGDPLQKYAAKLSGINEEFDKVGDAKLRDAQIKKLDADTFHDLKSKEPDHQTHLELYGRRGSVAGLPVQQASSAAATLTAVKSQAATLKGWDQKIHDIWQLAVLMKSAQQTGAGQVNFTGIP